MKLLLTLLIPAITAWALPTAVPEASNSVVVVPVPPPVAAQPSDPQEYLPFHDFNRTLSIGIIPTAISTTAPTAVPTAFMTTVPEPHTPKPIPADGEPSDAYDDTYHLACTSSIVSRFCSMFSLCTPQAELMSPFGGCNVFCSYEANGQTPDVVAHGIGDGKALDTAGEMPEVPKIEKPRLPEGHPDQPELGRPRPGRPHPEVHRPHEPIALPEDIRVEGPRVHQTQPAEPVTSEFHQHDIHTSNLALEEPEPD